VLWGSHPWLSRTAMRPASSKRPEAPLYGILLAVGRLAEKVR